MGCQVFQVLRGEGNNGPQADLSKPTTLGLGMWTLVGCQGRGPVPTNASFGPSALPREGPRWMESRGRAGEAQLSVSAMGHPHPKQLSQEHWGSHFLLGPMMPGSSAWNLSLREELRTVPHQDPDSSLAPVHQEAHGSPKK